MTPVNVASALELTVNFPGSRYTLKLPVLSLLNVVVSPLESRAVNVPFTIGFSSAPRTRPETISADAGRGNAIATMVARNTAINVIRMTDTLRCHAGWDQQRRRVDANSTLTQPFLPVGALQ